MKVSVVVPAYNAESTIGEQLEALWNQDYNDAWEVVVADNGSEDNTRLIVTQWMQGWPSLRLIDASSRRGPSAARNIGVSSARGSVILHCDADDVVQSQWVRRMSEALANQPVVGGALDVDTWINDPTVIQWYGRSATSPAERDTSVEGLPSRAGFTIAIGANIGYRREVFDAIGGWDEKMNGGGDDLDFCIRSQLGGYPIGFAPNARVHYRYRVAIPDLMRQHRNYGRADALLAQKFEFYHVQPKKILRSIAWLGFHIPDLAATSDRRGFWLRTAASCWGQISGWVSTKLPSEAPLGLTVEDPAQ